jgi:RNase adaptor protein for sRNA GlmZ degradation
VGGLPAAARAPPWPRPKTRLYCVDNLRWWIDQFRLCAKSEPPIEKIALAIDTREPGFLAAARRSNAAGARRRGRGAVPDCANEALVNRYRERAVHPQAPAGTVEEGSRSSGACWRSGAAGPS